MPNYSWAFGTSKACNPIVGMSSRTKDFRSPSKLAIRGLEAVISGDIDTALTCEEQLKFFEKEVEGGLFYVFLDDYKDAWPFHLRAPWASAFTQGIALEFYMEMAKRTGDSYYRKKADKIFLSYAVPIERGGFSRYVKEGVVFEEYPVEQQIAVLNGNLIATLALYDYARYSNNAEPERLARRAVGWLEKNVHRYMMTDPRYPNPISAYSLAPARLDLLFRFYLTKGSLDIFSIALVGEEFSRTIILGTKQDDDVSSTASLIVSPDMNWSSAYTDSPPSARGSFRKVIQEGGAFNHAPFRMEVASADEWGRLNKGAQLTLVYRAQGSSDVQVSDGKTFYKVATLSPTDGQLLTVTLDVPQAALANIHFPSELKFNTLYLEHNQKLLGLVSDISGSAVLKKYSDLLKH